MVSNLCYNRSVLLSTWLEKHNSYVDRAVIEDLLLKGHVYGVHCKCHLDITKKKKDCKCCSCNGPRLKCNCHICFFLKNKKENGELERLAVPGRTTYTMEKITSAMGKLLQIAKEIKKAGTLTDQEIENLSNPLDEQQEEQLKIFTNRKDRKLKKKDEEIQKTNNQQKKKKLRKSKEGDNEKIQAKNL